MSAVLAFEKPGKPVLRGVEHYWAVIRELDESDGGFTVNAVDKRSDSFSKSSVRDYVRRLVAAGMATVIGSEILEAGADATPIYCLTGAKPLRAPRVRRDGTVARGGAGQQQMWTVMRGPLGRDGFTFHDLALWATTDDVSVTKETARSYLKRLASVGYLLQLRSGGTGKAAVWKLKPTMNTGPRAPLILKAQIVVDQNRMAAVGPIEAEEASS